MIYLWFALVLVFSGCERELSLNQVDGISNSIDDYEPQLRIEAIMYPSEGTAIIRIDRTFSLDELGLYNCMDDDGDWIPYDDLNSNGVRDPGEPLIHDLGEDGQLNDPDDDDGDGITDEPSIGEDNGVPDCGEPNVDEYDEILPLVNVDSTICPSVKITGPDGTEYPFRYDPVAGTLLSYPEYTPGQDVLVTADYGAWVPVDSIPFHAAAAIPEVYSLECDCGDFGVITATDTLSSPVRFYGDSLAEVPLYENILNYPVISQLLGGCEVDNFWITSSSGEILSRQQVFFTSTFDARSFWVKVEEFSPTNINTDTCEPNSLNYIHSFPAFSFEEQILGDSVYVNSMPMAEIPGYYRVQVQTMSPGFERYFLFSDMNLYDPVRSNLRDDTGDVVMGTFGSLITETLYAIVQLPPVFYFGSLNMDEGTIQIRADDRSSFFLIIGWFHFALKGIGITGEITGGVVSDSENWNVTVIPATGEVIGSPVNDGIPPGDDVEFITLRFDPSLLQPGDEICIDDIGFQWEGHDLPYVVFYGPCITVE